MGSRSICLYKIDESEIDGLPGFQVTGSLDSRERLRLAIGTDDLVALIVDLDHRDSLDAIVETLEIKSEIAVVGITGSTDVEFVLSAQRAGCRQIISKPIDANHLVVAIRLAMGETVRRSAGAQTIAVFGSIGGAGVTTIACGLSMALGEVTQSEIAIVDLDFDFGGVARAWDINTKYTIADVNATGATEACVIEDAIVHMPGGVRVLARPPTIEQGTAIDEASIGRILGTMKKMYPYLILDLPRKLDSVTGCAIQQCDKLVIVLQLTVPAISNARRFVDALTRFGMSLDNVEFVVNRYRKNVHALTVECVEDRLGKKVIATLPNDFRSVAAAIDIGKPISAHCAFSQAIKDLAIRLSGCSQAPPKKGWLSNLKLGR